MTSLSLLSCTHDHVSFWPHPFSLLSHCKEETAFQFLAFLPLQEQSRFLYSAHIDIHLAIAERWSMKDHISMVKKLSDLVVCLQLHLPTCLSMFNLLWVTSKNSFFLWYRTEQINPSFSVIGKHCARTISSYLFRCQIESDTVLSNRTSWCADSPKWFLSWVIFEMIWN